MAKRAELTAHFSAFVDQNLSKLVRIARSLTGSAHAADDLVQASLEKAFRSWEKAMYADDTFAYVRRIMVNSKYDAWRRERRFKEIFGFRTHDVEVHSDADWASPEGSFDAAHQIDHLLEPLTGRERRVITLRFVEDLTEAEIAEELGVARGTVKATASRALKKMRVAESGEREGVSHGYA